jgi:hypothetical protein
MLWASIGLGEHIGPELIAGFGLVVVSLVLILSLPLPGVLARGIAAPQRAVRALRPSAAPLP